MLIHTANQLILDQPNALGETLQFIVTETQRAINALRVDILFKYADRLRIEVSSDGVETERFVPIEGSIPGLALSAGKPVLVNDPGNDSLLRKSYSPLLKMDRADQTLRLSILTAAFSLDGQAIGVISVEGTPDNGFGQLHLDFVNAAARQISMAISHAVLFDQDNFMTATDSLLVDAVSGDSDLVMRQVLEHMVNVLSSLTFVKPDAADVLFTDTEDDQSLTVTYSTNSSDIGVRVDVSSNVCGEAMRHARTVLLQPTSERPDYRSISGERMRSELAIPITLGDGNRAPVGILNLGCVREYGFSNVGIILADRFAQRVAYAIAMTKIRADIDRDLSDQLMILAADQVLNAVHRINNYVGSVQAMVVDLLEDLHAPGDLDAADLTQRLRMIDDSAKRALEIPIELRERLGTPRESADINEQVEAGLAAVRIPRHIELVTDLAPGLPNIPCTALDLVVENLVLNAVRAMQGQPGSLRVRTWLDERRPLGPFIVITVQDTGVGMTEDQVHRLFEPGHPGSGLGFGMMWVRSWVRRAQGLIGIDSAPGVGTTVNIRFQTDPLMTDRTQGGDGST
jgi:GAF domain-containing protein